MEITPIMVEKFWEKVVVAGGCWEWTGTITPDGYGRLRLKGRNVPAHRFSYEISNGPIPDDALIDHRCHNKSCVKASHLRPVTKKQNAEHRKGANVNSRTGVRGVWQLTNGKYKARVMHDGKSCHVGTFVSLSEAEAATAAKRLELFTHNDMDRSAA